MLQRWKNRRIEEEGGFTLIELLVVIIILGILAAVVVFAVGGVGDKGQSASCVIDTRTIRTAEEAYAGSAAGGGKYTNMAGLVSGGFLSEPSIYHDVKSTVAAETAPPFTGFLITIKDTRCGGNVGDTVDPANGKF